MAAVTNINTRKSWVFGLTDVERHAPVSFMQMVSYMPSGRKLTQGTLFHD
jgi:hypothetical protein